MLLALPNRYTALAEPSRTSTNRYRMFSPCCAFVYICFGVMRNDVCYSGISIRVLPVGSSILDVVVEWPFFLFSCLRAYCSAVPSSANVELESAGQVWHIQNHRPASHVIGFPLLQARGAAHLRQPDRLEPRSFSRTCRCRLALPRRFAIPFSLWYGPSEGHRL